MWAALDEQKLAFGAATLPHILAATRNISYVYYGGSGGRAINAIATAFIQRIEAASRLSA
jgi:hypothetical protein